MYLVNTPDRTTAAAFNRYLNGQVLADSAALQWTGLYVRLCRLPRVVDSFLVPATPEPLITCNAKGSADFRERDVGGAWITRRIEPGAMFVTHSKTPYEVRWTSPAGQVVIQIHLAVDVFLAALAAAWPGQTDRVEVIDFFGRDDAFAHLCQACADMLTARTRGNTRRVADLTRLIASYLVEKYTDDAREKAEVRGGLPIRQLHQVEDHISERLADEISVESLASLVALSPFHFSRVFKQTTGVSPLQFVTRERITRAQQIMRETKRSLIEIALEVGYTSPSAFAQVFRRVVGVTPTKFRAKL